VLDNLNFQRGSLSLSHGMRNELYLNSKLAWEHPPSLAGFQEAEVFLRSYQKKQELVEPFQRNAQLVAHPMGHSALSHSRHLLPGRFMGIGPLLFFVDENRYPNHF